MTHHAVRFIRIAHLCWLQVAADDEGAQQQGLAADGPVDVEPQHPQSHAPRNGLVAPRQIQCSPALLQAADGSRNCKQIEKL